MKIILASLLLILSLSAQAAPSNPSEDNISQFAVRATLYQTSYVTPEAIATALHNYFGYTFWYSVSSDGVVSYIVSIGTGANTTYYREFLPQ